MVNNKILVSVIVPIWNTGDYLIECLDSILNQTFSNLEIILINDGSTDNSLELCQSYQKRDSRIIIIDKPNSGLSDTRNVGLSNISGDYVLFIDSDDIVSITHIEQLVSTALYYQSDITIGGLEPFNDGTVIDLSKDSNTIYKTYRIEKVDALKQMIFSEDFSWQISNKLYIRSCIKDTKFDVKERFGEDLSFFCSAILNAKKLAVIANRTYFYRQRVGSMTRDRKLIKVRNFIYILKKFSSFIHTHFKEDYWLYSCLSMILYFQLVDGLIRLGIRNKRIENLGQKRVLKSLISNVFNKKIPLYFKFRMLVFSFSIDVFLFVSSLKHNI